MCRLCSMASAAPKKPAWYIEIFEQGQQQPLQQQPLQEQQQLQQQGQPAAAAAVAGPPGAIYGWDAEVENAWRADTEGRLRGYSCRLFARPGSQPHDSTWAMWPDGDEHKVAKLSTENLQSMQKPSSARGRKK